MTDVKKVVFNSDSSGCLTMLNLLAAVQYLKTYELLFGEAVTVDYLNLFDQGALSTLCSS